MKLKIMTLNLRNDLADDGINSFRFRRNNIVNAISRENPDIIGFQEATDNIRHFLRECLNEYVVIGGGRDIGCTGEASCIAYKKFDFELINFESKILSLTPDVFGTRHHWSDQSEYARMFVRAELQHKEMSKPINVFNTHFDHTGEQTKIIEMVQLLQCVSQHNKNIVLMGDFNSYASSSVVAMPISGIANVKLAECTKDITVTFHNYGKISSDSKIDYIFTDGETKACYAVNDAHIDGIYISDHYPICAEIEFD